jgi:hypothetical protein
MSDGQEFELSQIPGLGPVRRAALVEAGVESLEALLALKVAELAAIQGIGVWQARKIREYLRQRGLLVETEDGVALVVEDAEDAALVEDAVAAIGQRAEVEARLEAEVETLAEALVEERQEAELAQEAAIAQEQVELLSQSGSDEQSEGDEKVALDKANGNNPVGPAVEAAPQQEEVSAETASDADAEETVPETEEAFGTAPDAEAPDAATNELASRISEQREQLPEITLTLMESIRQAAVLPQLTRQITRLLITSGELISSSRPLSEKTLNAASETLARAEQAVQQAVEKRTFSQTAQKELARRIRRRRKELEALLEQK